MTEVGLVESAERVLCELYTDIPQLKRLLGNANLDLGQFEFAGDQRSAVNSCLRTANGLEKVPEIIKTALRDHPNHDGLKGLSDKFEMDRPLADNIAEAVKDLSGFRVQLRWPRHLTRDQLKKFDAALQKLFDLTTEFAEGRRDDGAASPGQWDELNRALQDCLGQFQLYCELLDASAGSHRRRVPGASYARSPLAEVAADKMALIEAKLNLCDSVNEVVRSWQRAV